jgi:hypothetical protein
LATVALLVLGGCNFVTGAAHLGLGDVSEDDTPDAASDTWPGFVPARGVTITDVVAYQALEHPLLLDGREVTSAAAPLVAGRDTLLRVFYRTASHYDGQPVHWRVRVGSGRADVLRDGVGRALGAASRADLYESTINIHLPGALLESAEGWRLDLMQRSGGDAPTGTGASHPARPGELGPLALATTGDVRVTLVPVVYVGETSTYAPEIGDKHRSGYEARLGELLPARRVEVALGKQAVTWNQPLHRDGTGWPALREHIRELRLSQGAAPNDLYFGVVAPAESFASYCAAGCKTGESYVAGPDDASWRVGVGLGFGDEHSYDLAAHEVGHMLGLLHAPCSAEESLDPSFPEPDGSLGAHMGWRARTGELLESSPEAPLYDFMSYCDPAWVSPYHWRRLADRLRQINGD